MWQLDAQDGCLQRVQAEVGADEVMVLTITGDYPSRLQSYERLIAAF